MFIHSGGMSCSARGSRPCSEGIYLSPRAFLALRLEVTAEQVVKFVEATTRFLTRYRPAIGVKNMRKKTGVVLSRDDVNIMMVVGQNKDIGDGDGIESMGSDQHDHWRR